MLKPCHKGDEIPFLGKICLSKTASYSFKVREMSWQSICVVNEMEENEELENNNSKRKNAKWTFLSGKEKQGRDLLRPLEHHNRPLEGKTAMVAAGDTVKGRSMALSLARQGANISLLYEHSDKEAARTKRLVEREGVHTLLLKGKVEDRNFYQKALDQTILRFGRIHILINNVG